MNRVSFLVNRAKASLSIVNCQLSIAKAPLSILNCQLSILIALAALMTFSGCKSKDDDNKTVVVASVSVSPSTLSLVEGSSSQKLSAAVLPADATDKTVTWSSSATGVATVATDGTVTAVKAGTATITENNGGKKGE